MDPVGFPGLKNGNKPKNGMYFPDQSPRFLWSVYLILCLPVLVVSYLGFSNIYQGLTDLVYARREAIVNLAANNIKQKFNRLEDVAVSLATRAAFSKLVSEKKWAAALEEITNFRESFPSIDRIFLCDVEGNEMAAFPELEGGVGHNFSHRDWYQGVRRQWRPYISEVYRRAARPRINVIGVAAPVRDGSGAVCGILVLQVPVKIIIDWSRSIDVGRLGFIYSVDPKGHVIGHPEHSSEKDLVDFQNFQVFKNIVKGTSGVGVFNQPGGSRPYLNAYYPVPGYRWGVILSQEYQAAAAERDKSLIAISILFIVVLALSFILNYFILLLIRNRHQSQSQIRKMQDRFRNLIESNVIGIVVADTAGNILEANGTFLRMTGYSWGDLLEGRLRWDAMTPPEWKAADRAAFRSLREHGVAAPAEKEYLRKDGSRVPVFMGGVTFEELPNGEHLCLCFVLDLSEKYKQQEFFRAALEAAPSAMILEDSEGKIVLVNSEAEKMFGYARSELIGGYVEKLIPRRFLDFYHIHQKSFFANPKRWSTVEADRDFCLVRKDGTEIPVETTLNPVAHDGKTLVLSSSLDITQNKIAEQEKRERDKQEAEKISQVLAEATRGRREAEEALILKNRDLETLLYVISHDLKEPLRAVQSFAQIIDDRYRPVIDAKGQDLFGRIVRAAGRMNVFLDEIATLAHARKIVVPGDLIPGRDIVAEVLERLRHTIEKKHARIRVADNLPPLKIDKTWATIAVYNLIVNALKFSKNGENPEIEITAYKPKPGERAGTGLTILDRGIGIHSENADRIFELFWRDVGREIEGSGAGLAIVREIAQRHGGWAWAAPRQGGGSVFNITFGST